LRDIISIWDTKGKVEITPTEDAQEEGVEKKTKNYKTGFALRSAQQMLWVMTN